MTDQMTLVAQFYGEYLLAVLALIFDPFMLLHVHCVIGTRIESFPAFVTVEAVLTGVYLHVLIQVPSGGILLFTLCAAESVSAFLRLFNCSSLLRCNKLINLCEHKSSFC